MMKWRTYRSKPEVDVLRSLGALAKGELGHMEMTHSTLWKVSERVESRRSRLRHAGGVMTSDNSARLRSKDRGKGGEAVVGTMHQRPFDRESGEGPAGLK